MSAAILNTKVLQKLIRGTETRIRYTFSWIHTLQKSWLGRRWADPRWDFCRSVLLGQHSWEDEGVGKGREKGARQGKVWAVSLPQPNTWRSSGAQLLQESAPSALGEGVGLPISASDTNCGLAGEGLQTREHLPLICRWSSSGSWRVLLLRNVQLPSLEAKHKSWEVGTQDR